MVRACGSTLRGPDGTPAPDARRIGDQPTMAPPRDRLGAEDRRPGSFGVGIRSFNAAANGGVALESAKRPGTPPARGSNTRSPIPGHGPLAATARHGRLFRFPKSLKEPSGNNLAKYNTEYILCETAALGCFTADSRRRPSHIGIDLFKLFSDGS